MAEAMNYIDRLVAELCPDGVEYCPLKEVTQKVKSIKWDKSDGKQYEYIDLSSIPTGGFTITETTAIDAQNAPSRARQIIHAGDVLFGSTRPLLNRVAVVPAEYDGQICSTGYSVIRVIDNLVLPSFVFHVLRSISFRTYVEQKQTGAAYPAITSKAVLEYLIPVPPMQVQEAIVEILDKFTNLEAELEAELEARTLQYEYYRDSLFEALDCPRVPLGSFAQLVRGSGMPKTDFSESGVGAIHYGQIYTKFGTATAEVIAHVPEGKAKKLAVVNPGDVIVANTSENLEDVCKAVAWVGESDIVTGGHATVIKAPEQNAKFISYYMATGQFNKDKRRHAFGTKVIDVAPKNLAKIEFPLPSLEEQQRIVDILDRFDALTTSLSEGLPAELAARRSQYEYYRDQLLTFPRKGENQ